MKIDLLPWLIGWAVVTTVVIVLALYRTSLAAHEPPGLSLDDQKTSDLQARIDHKLLVVDRWGKTLTVVSAVWILLVAAAWAYQTYLKSYEVIGH